MRSLLDPARALWITRVAPLPLALEVLRHGPHFGAVLAASARRFGARTALVDAAGVVSYDELWRAARVASAGFRAGERVRLGCRDDRWLLVGVAAASLVGSHVTLVAPGAPDSLDSAAVRALAGAVNRTPASRAAPKARPSLTFLTTGSTGLPKPVQRTRFRLRQALPAASLFAALGPRPGEPVLVLAPLFHGHGFSVTAACLLVGAPVVLGSGSTALGLARAYRVGIVVGVPAQLHGFVGEAVPSVRRFACGSAPLSSALATSLLQSAEVIDFFGSTETGTVTVASARDVALGSVGRPAAGVRVRIIDGWVEVASPLAARAGFQRTGDRGRLERGRLYLSGRADGVTVVGGENVCAERLEDWVREQPEVRDVRVTVRPDDRLGSALVLRAELTKPLASQALRERISQGLGRAWVPTEIELIASELAGATFREEW